MIRSFTAAAAFLAVSAGNLLADSFHSDWRSIVRIESYFTTTVYLLDGGTACNGTNDNLPRFELRASDSYNGPEEYRHKKALLLAAYTSGDQVRLRCENGRLTDFEIRKN